MPSSCMLFQAKSYLGGGSINNIVGWLGKASSYSLSREQSEEPSRTSPAAHVPFWMISTRGLTALF